jgi:aldehyde:ferredoxin oxidoreductase
VSSYLYAGEILKIDLETRAITKAPTSDYSDTFLGGRGINIKLLLEHLSHGVDPLGPDNVLVFGVGPLAGAFISAGRTEVTAKSPETGFLGSSNFGGFFASELKYAGYDHILITGKAGEPVYVSIEDDHVEIRDASAIWGVDTYTAPSLIRDEIDNPEAKIVCIGQAGENLIRFSTIQHEHGHGAGRTGMGAVMGSKNLKAIAVSGTKGIELADPLEFLAIAGEAEEELKNDPFWQQVAQEGASRAQDEYVFEVVKEKFPPQHGVYQKFKSKRAGCFGCPIQCMDHYQEVEGIGTGVMSCEMYDAWVYGVRCYDEYTSLACGLLSQRYGVDAMSTAAIIQWLMVLQEKGIITEADTDGIPMEWGNPGAIRAMLDKIVFRDGVGDILAEGLVSAAEEVGRGSEAFANQVKGLPMIPMQIPEDDAASRPMSLAAAVGPRGGDSLRTYTGEPEHTATKSTEALEIHKDILRHEAKISNLDSALDQGTYEDKAGIVAYYEDAVLISDMLSTCKWMNRWSYGAWSPELLARLVSAGSGVERSVDDLFDYARKIRTLERAYEAGEGLTREHDTLPRKAFKLANEEGHLLDPEKFEQMKSEYYELRGWDRETGLPADETLKELGVDDLPVESNR